MDMASIAQIVGGFATGFAAAVAIFGAMFAKSEIDTGRESAAIAAFQEYQRLGFDNPSMATGTPSPSDAERYRWFVGIALTACERILLATRSRHWQDTVVDHLRYHHARLSTPDFRENYLPHYSPRLRTAILDAVKAGPR